MWFLIKIALQDQSWKCLVLSYIAGQNSCRWSLRPLVQPFPLVDKDFGSNYFIAGVLEKALNRKCALTKVVYDTENLYPNIIWKFSNLIFAFLLTS